MYNPHVFANHFTTLAKTMRKHDIFDKPEAIYNVDKSFACMDVQAGKVLVNRKSSSSYSKAIGSKEHITINICISAAGQVLPPMIIYEKNFPAHDYARKGPTGALYAH